jgi:type IV pilus secretin PilQ/predicted competence protein
VIRGLALVLTVAVAGTLVSASGRPEPDTAVTGAHLKTISLRAHAKGSSLVIEATDPVGYVATQPDPLTLLLDLRNVAADGVTNSAATGTRSPIAGVAVRSDEINGAITSRVTITLSQPVAHHVRSERNTIVVDFDQPSPVPYVMPPQASRAPAVAPREAEIAQSPALDPISSLGLNMPIAAQAAPGAAIRPAAAALQAPVVPVLPATPPAQADQNARRFTGSPISLDFQGADLRAVLRTFAEVSGLNIVIDPSIQGTVDVALRDVPWDQALDIILRANKLGYSVDGTIVRIAPIAALASEEKDRSDLAKAQADAGTMSTLTRQLSYSKGEDIVAILKQASILSARGQAFVDPRTNTLIVTDLQDRLTNTTELINTLDRPQPQVEIEARIVQANRNYARAIGVQWGFLGSVSPALGNTTGLAFPNSGTIGGATGGTQGAAAVPTGVNLAAPAATSGIGLALGAVNGAFNLDAALTAAETSGQLRILSTPRVSTQNNGEAEITQGVQIPIQTVANNTVTVLFKDAALTLKVTPQITAAGTVIMKIALENSQADFSRAVNGIPPINTQRANTQVLVLDGQTTVIGGIYTSQEQSQTDRTPGLGQVPLLKWLFKRDTLNDQSTELLIFITPRIIKN